MKNLSIVLAVIILVSFGVAIAQDSVTQKIPGQPQKLMNGSGPRAASSLCPVPASAAAPVTPTSTIKSETCTGDGRGYGDGSKPQPRDGTGFGARAQKRQHRNAGLGKGQGKGSKTGTPRRLGRRLQDGSCAKTTAVTESK